MLLAGSRRRFRYLRLWLALARYGLIRELTFRSNFLVRIGVEVLWFGILLIFYDTVFTHAGGQPVAGWQREEYFFFVGCYFALGGLIETLFLSNCGEFANLVRSGDLDFYLLKPIDEQFLVSCHDFDWATAPNVLMGGGLMSYALMQLPGWTFDPLLVGLFLMLFVCGLALAYSFLLILTALSVWLVRNQSLYEVWWLFSTLMRYPREIFTNSWAAPVARVFTYAIPVMVVVSVPADVMVRVLDPGAVAFMVIATVVMLWVARKFFRLALRRYRSASS
ncbi:MAG: ABC-2 family transporter protein [Gemmataceae bacterium]|nr:ABC-2 family transporter protein [Gemmataceae bacterium]